MFNLNFLGRVWKLLVKDCVQLGCPVSLQVCNITVLYKKKQSLKTLVTKQTNKNLWTNIVSDSNILTATVVFLDIFSALYI